MSRASRIRKEKHLNQGVINNEQQAAPKKAKKLIVSIVCAVLVVAFVFGALLYANGSIFSRNKTAVYSENYPLTTSMATYFFNVFYKSDLAQYADLYLYSYGLDTSVSLKKQYYNQEEKITWFNYFMTNAKSSMMETILFCEAAHDAGVSLDETELAEIEKTIESLKTTAESRSMSFKKYLRQEYGKGVQENDVRECLKLLALADKQYETEKAKFKPTIEQVNKYYDENRIHFDQCSYLSYSFNGTNAEQNAQKLATKGSIEQFKQEIRNYLKKTTKKNNDEIEKEISNAEVLDATYEQSDASMTWLFDKARKVGETKVFSSGNTYTAYIITEAPHRDETQSVHVRHILFSSAEYGNKAAARVKAQEVLTEWQIHGKSVSKFEELCAQFSADPETRTTGGIYESYVAGYIPEAYEFDEWCFSEKRQPGDIAILDAEYGVHLMVLESFGDAFWRLNALEVMTEEHMDKLHNDYFTSHTITYENAILNDIDPV